jgi:hypothetical protein
MSGIEQLSFRRGRMLICSRTLKTVVGSKGELMKRTGLLVAGLFLATALVVPMATRTTAKPQGVSVRVYDRNHKDYHDWDDNESRRYEGYRKDHPEYNVTFGKNNRRQQSTYWTWRHQHSEDK